MPNHAEARERKTNFDNIYDRPDPRNYFLTLKNLDYEIPQCAKPVLLSVIDRLKNTLHGQKSKLHVLDLGCSYGINAALLKCSISLPNLFDRYSLPEIRKLDSANLVKSDTKYFKKHMHSTAIDITGLDRAKNAISYAASVGLLDRGWAENLESSTPSPGLAECLRGVDLIISTGAIGYITERTFDRLLAVRRETPPPWIASFVLRTVSYDRIAEALEAYGLVTHRLEGVVFPQRRFSSKSEEAGARREIEARGIDTTGLEDTGRYYADFYLSRPASEAALFPIDEVLGATTEQAHPIQCASS
ncbi:UNVERIFIED_ORG: SAM-dependent methyltransferase [Rhodococcus erythropolis]